MCATRLDLIEHACATKTMDKETSLGFCREDKHLNT
jgi:hypothetical protein